MIHKLIESVTTNAAIWTGIILIVGFGLVKWFAWMARREAKREKLWDERSIYD
jgi:hypothetical protein